ncbi:MAG TPA: butyrate kinase [Bacteroidales bacterium]|nr:butyrate kinase [Bacteroidales bacterium]HOS72196.1 butyrate kinase [Bacteroidales bacterium]HQH24904.1 butyrate kinase [Bacteroidales bacterium]HQJ81911.1 butyrate kinase [Bacteroidales bacterium]
MPMRLILVINPGSTSTKFALYADEKLIMERNLTHSSGEVTGYGQIRGQLDFRRELILKELEEQKVNMSDIRVIVGRGGLVRPIESGVYRVNEKMISDLEKGLLGQHASNLGGLIANALAAVMPNAEAYIVDPVVVDELQPVARISGHPSISRISIFHALNQKAVARMYAASLEKRYEDMNLIIAHMGGGVSVGAHRRGRVVDVNNALDGDGPFAPERSGSLPSGQLADLCFSGKHSYAEIRAMITGRGGMVAYLGTNSFREVCRKAEEGDAEAILVRDAAAYQTAKEIGSAAAVLEGRVDAIILTGGMAFQEDHVERIKRMVGFIAPVIVYPGEDELRSLAYNGLLALDGKISVRDY